MEFFIKFVPYGHLPYESATVAANMQAKLMPGSPYLSILTKLEKISSTLNRTLANFPVFKVKNKNIIYEEDKQFISIIDSIYNEPNIDNTSPYRIESVFKEDFFRIIKENNSQYALVSLYGPFSISQMVRNTSGISVDISDKILRKLLIQCVTIKALSIIYEIKNISPTTVPIIIFEEPLLNRFNSLAKKNPSITYDLLVYLYKKFFDVIHEAGAKVAIRSMDKCKWTIPIDAGVDMISFDAYRNPHNLRIIANDIKAFISRGGNLNYAIVPTTTVKEVQNMKPDTLYKNLCLEIEELAQAGVPRQKLYAASSISFYGEAGRLPILYAERASMTAANLAKKLAIIQDLYR